MERGMSWKVLPKLVVFDLDYTLWPFYVDSNVDPPFKKQNSHIVDARGSRVKCYPEATAVLQFLKEMNCDMAVASRTSELNGATQLIKLFDWDKYFKYREIYTGSKVVHFKEFKKASGLEYEEMLFFDDEHRNITDLTKQNVTCFLVKNGMTLKVLHEGLNMFADK